ncbi:MAG: hypothetical protein GEV06_11140 [Luteitalea sp.]|nr:hypothetical protein [Luteitalea sp.]
MSAGLGVAREAAVVGTLAVRKPRGEHLFFSSMAAAAALTVFAGFAPTYYLKGTFDAPALTPLLHLHGALFTSWILLFILQTSLVAAKRTDIHRRLGVIGGLLAVAMVVAGGAAALWSVRRGFTPPGGPPPLVFFAIPVGDLVVFPTLVGCALLYRRRPDTHKRLMLLATIGLLTAAIARLPVVAGTGPLVFFGLTDLFVVVCLLHDRLMRGRIHPAFLWGGLFLIVSQPLRLAIAGTGAWLAFAAWVAG